jgi:hypothetical protein
VRTVLFHVGAVPVAVVAGALGASAATPLQFDVLVVGLSVGSVVGWVGMRTSGDGPVVTDNDGPVSVARRHAWSDQHPARTRESFGRAYRYYVSLVASAVVGWGVLLVGA